MASYSPNESGYLQLFRERKREVSFSILLNLGSSVGQTYFISLMLPGMALSAGLSVEETGSFYAIATVLSAVLLALTGHWADRWHPRIYAVGCMSLLGMAALLASNVSGWMSLFLALVLVRWGGQGLLPHASSVAIAKSFPRRPGAAYALASLGFPLGEALFPVVLVAALAMMPNAAVWMWVAGVTWFLGVPLVWWTGQACRVIPKASLEVTPAQPVIALVQPKIWRDATIWWLAPYLIAVPFVMTAMLFYQPLMLQQTNWSPWLWATSLGAYAFVRAILSLLSGGWFSKCDALPWLVITQMPITAGIGILFFQMQTNWALFLFFALAGVSMGMQMVVGKTALVEIYGPKVIGRAKAATNAITVLSTAAAPPVMAAAARVFDGAWTNVVIGGSALVMLLSTGWTLMAQRILKARNPSSED